MRARDVTLATLVASLREDFNSHWLRCCAVEFNCRTAPGGGCCHGRIRHGRRREFLASDEPLCGRVQTQKLDVLFGAMPCAVSALLPLGKYGIL